MRIKLRYVMTIIVIGAIAAAVPFGTGILFKQGYLALLHADQNEKIQVLEYSNGWLSSDAKILVKLKDDTTPGSAIPSAITLVQHITHGPYLKNPSDGQWLFLKAAIETQVHLDDKTETKIFGGASEQGVMQINTIVSFLNNYLSQFQTPLFNIKITDDAKLTWLGLHGTVSADVTGKYFTHVVTQINNGTLSFHSGASSFAISPSTLENDINCGEGKVCTGTQKLFIPDMTTTNQKGDLVKVTGITLNFSGDQQGNSYSNSYDILLKNFTSPDTSAGPVNFRMECNNLNAAEIINLSTQIRAAQKEILKSPSPQLFMAGELNSALAKLVMVNTSVNGDLKVVTPSGNLSATAKLFWPPATPLPTTTDQIAAKINIHLNLRVAAALVDQIIKTMDTQKNNTVSPDVKAPVVAAPKVDYESALPNVTQFKDQLDMMEAHKEITADVKKNVIALQEQQTQTHEFNSYIDDITRTKQISSSAAYTLKTAYDVLFRGEQRGMLITIFSEPATTLPALAEKINTMVNMKIITGVVGKELIELQNQSLAPEIYSVALGRFVEGNLISSDVQSQLKAQYTVINKDLSLNPEIGEAANTASSSAEDNAAPPPEGKMQKQFDLLKKQGYIAQDKDDYVISAVYENGVIKINGVTFN